MKKGKKLLILVNYLSFFVSHRLSIAEAAIAEGLEVYIGYGDLGGANLKSLNEKGFKISFVPMEPGSVNILKDLKTAYHMLKFIGSIKPDIVHLVTIKPNIYGGIISRFLGVPGLVSAVSGLGTLFINQDFKTRFLRLILYPLFKLAFNHRNQKVVLQNKDDLKLLVNWGVLDTSKVVFIKGSGVELKDFKNFDEKSGIITICFAARLLRDKGVYEFISAAKILKKRGIKARFLLAGELDTNNPSGLSLEDLNNIIKENYVQVLGYQENISNLYENSHIICLPSYREGLPKSLIEAAAASRAVVTTDVPGCRDAIIPNITGLLVPLKDYKKLAEAIQWLIEHPETRINMGKAGRKFAEKEFSIEKIVKYHLNVYQNLLATK